MWFKRDIEGSWGRAGALEVRLLQGPRQVGKTALLDRLAPPAWRRATLDDLQLRELANRDPGLFFDDIQLPAVVDEMQYAPPLFAEIKRRVDEARRLRRASGAKAGIRDLLWATGSSQIFFDRNVKESLAGRASHYQLHTLALAELRAALPDLALEAWLLRGGWPELHATPEIDPIRYLDDYLRSYVERDVVFAAGIQKVAAFHTVMALLAARTGSLLNLSDIAGAAGVEVSTVGDWTALLERTNLFMRLAPYHSNLNKRLIKTPKIHVLDVGLATRLQGWREATPAVLSPQIGCLFESAVVGEVLRCRDNHLLDWQLFFWRTKEGEEVDLIVRRGDGRTVALEAKFAHQGVPDVPLTSAFRKTFPDVREILAVTWGGEPRRLSETARQVPLARLRDVLLSELG